VTKPDLLFQLPVKLTILLWVGLVILYHSSRSIHGFTRIIFMAAESQELKDAGLKITLPRVKILQILESADVHHVSAEDVYKKLLANGEEIGLATVYRVLTQFEQAGLIVRHNFEGGHSVFELSSDQHHDHIVCLRCGKVEEFNDSEIERRQEEVARGLGFELTDHHLNLYGLCPDCARQ